MSSPQAFKSVKTSFEEFLKSQPRCVEYRLVVTKNTKNETEFYLHPFNQNGETLDFSVKGDNLTCITRRAID
jgi:hypothetical protein